VNRAIQRLVALALVVFGAGACRGQPAEDPPVMLMRNMYHQQRYNPQGESAYYGDHRAMRTPPQGTVPRENYAEDERVALGREPDGRSYVLTVPHEVAAEFRGGMAGLVARGHERFDIYCSPCHGRVGDGQGMVFLRARVTGYTYMMPSNLHDDRLRHVPDGQLFATISNGIRNMPAYGSQIPVNDRWAIVAYVRALQLSQAPANGAAQ